MHFSKRTYVEVTLDEVVEGVNSSEARFLIKPMVSKLIDCYQPLYNAAKENEKQFKKKGDKELELWQRKRKESLLYILNLLAEMLVSLHQLNVPLKVYHNELMGCKSEVTT